MDTALLQLTEHGRKRHIRLVRAYYRIKSDKARKRIFELTKTIAKAGDTE